MFHLPLITQGYQICMSQCFHCGFLHFQPTVCNTKINRKFKRGISVYYINVLQKTPTYHAIGFVGTFATSSAKAPLIMLENRCIMLHATLLKLLCPCSMCVPQFPFMGKLASSWITDSKSLLALNRKNQYTLLEQSANSHSIWIADCSIRVYWPFSVKEFIAWHQNSSHYDSILSDTYYAQNYASIFHGSLIVDNCDCWSGQNTIYRNQLLNQIRGSQLYKRINSIQMSAYM